MTRLLKYRKPGLINLFELQTQTSDDVWVTAAFVQPGTHTYIVSDYRGLPQNHHANVHECRAEPRVEPIMTYERVTKIRKGDIFNRWKTIFAQWPSENEAVFRQCIEHDIKLWKVTRLIKDADDYADTIKILLKHAKLLVHLFIYLACKS